jgi:hypothetical protein
MLRFAGPAVALLVTCVAPLAQDVQGIEICTRQSGADRRTSCLQSNVEFLQQVISRNALDAQQRLGQANKEIAALKELLAGLQARVDQLQMPKPEAKPEAKPEEKPEAK